MDISTTSSGLTKARKSSHVFSWVIENFESEHMPASDIPVMDIRSPTFEALHPDGISVTSWTVSLSVDRTQITWADLHMEGCPSRYLQSDGLRCKYGIYVGTASQPKSHGHDFTRHFDLNPPIPCGWSSWISFQDLRDKGLLQNGSLRIQAELTMYAEPESWITSNIIVRTGNPGAAAAVTLEPILNLASLLNNQELSDIQFQCGPDTFPAHKAILAGRSEVFKTMLTSDMQEVHSGLVCIEDLSSTTFAIILSYIYTGEVNNGLDPDLFYEIIYGAEKYGLQALKNFCFRKLLQCICEKSIGALAVAAHLYGAEETIMMALRQFIVPQFFSLVKRNSDFKKTVEKYPAAFTNY